MRLGNTCQVTERIIAKLISGGQCKSRVPFQQAGIQHNDPPNQVISGRTNHAKQSRSSNERQNLQQEQN